MERLKEIDAFTEKIAAGIDQRAMDATGASTAVLIRNLANGVAPRDALAGGRQPDPGRLLLDRVHKRLIDWSLERGITDARFQALKDARKVVTGKIMELCR